MPLSSAYLPGTSLRARSSIVALILTVAILGVVIVIASRVLVGRFDAIEMKQAADMATQAVRALEADLNQLAVSTRDYAEWDDAHAFVLSRDPQFLRANFSYSSLDGMQVDVAAILDRDGNSMYDARIDSKSHSLIEHVPAEFLAIVRKLQPRTHALREQPSQHRLLNTPDGLMAFAIVEIAQSDRQDPTGAMLFFGRLLAADDIERIGKTSQLPVQMQSLASSQSPITDSDESFARIVDDVHIEGRAILHDWTGIPRAEIAVMGTRSIGALGRRTTGALMGTISFLILAGGALSIFMIARMHRQWLAHLEMQSRQQRILASLDELIAVVDPVTRQFIEGNASLLRTLDYAPQDLEHLRLKQVFLDIDEDSLRRSGADSIRLRSCRLHARDGRLVECEVSMTHLSEQEPSLVCIVARDMTQKHLADRQLHDNLSRLSHLEQHDSLTGLPNRDYLRAKLPELLAGASAQGNIVALFHIDIDHFKNINDMSGHALGDQVLNALACRLRDAAAPDSALLRLGGDEFMIATPVVNAVAVKGVAQRLLATIGAPIEQSGNTVTLTASIGVAIYPHDGPDTETLLKHADIALFQAKDKGRNCFQLFAHDMNVKLNEQVALEQALRRAIDTEQIFVEYQPVVDLHTGLLVSFEALARWRHPDQGIIPPVRFIPVAERSGMIIALGEQIVHLVTAQLREWQDAGLTLAPIAINVAPVQFERTEFANMVHERAMAMDIDPRFIAFEITESALLQNSDKHIVMIDTLRHAGSRVYIDDFGTGFSNLSYLKNLPADAVKIDQSFIRSIETDANDEAIVKSIIAVARQLRLDTIAEGIETAAIAEHLRQLGCRYGQGYYFSKPMAAAQCRALLEQLGDSRRFTETVKIRAFRQAGG
jgi:diguanylate cyclase (GGDEF)-like protein